MVVHEELKKVNVIVKASIWFGGNVLDNLKIEVDEAIELILEY